MSDDPFAGALGLDAGPTDDLLRAVTESVADALYVVDPDGHVLYANPAAVALLGYDDAVELLDCPSHQTIHYKRRDGSPFPQEECPLLEPLRTGTPVHVWEDWFVRRDGTFLQVSYSSAPLQLEDGRGAVVAFRDVGGRDHLDLIAAASAAALQHAAGLHASRARIAASADAAQRQLERDLHDGAQQQFSAVALRLELIRSLFERDPAAAAEELEVAQTQLQHALGELRELTRGIRPAILADHGVRDAIRELAVRTPLVVDLELAEVGRLPDAVESALYFVAAEALANTAKHAGATSAAIVLERGERAVRLTVTDDGNGEVDEARGSGLAGLRDRVETLGGAFRAVRAPEGGVRVTARIPVPPV